MTRQLQRLVVDHATELFQPLTAAAADLSARSRLLDQIGWNLDAIATLEPETIADGLTAAANALSEVDALATAGIDDLDKLGEALGLFRRMVGAVGQLGDGWSPPPLSGLPRDVLQTFVSDLLGFLLDCHLANALPRLRAGLTVLAILRQVDAPALTAAEGTVVRRSQRRPQFDLAPLGDALTDPAGLLRKLYVLDGATRRAADDVADLAAPIVVDALRQIGVLAGYGTPGAEVTAALTPAERAAATRLLHLALHTSSQIPGLDFDVLHVALGLIDMASGLGVVAVPAGRLDTSFSASDWTITAKFDGTIGPVVIDGHTVDFRGAANPSSRLAITAQHQPGKDEPLMRFGSATGTRLEVDGVDLGLELELNPAGATSTAMLAPQRLRLWIAAGKGDGFLASLLPAEPVRIDVPLALDWSPRGGLRIRGGAALEVAIPLHLSIGGASIPTLYMALAAQADGVSVELAAAIDASLGPVAASIDRLGLRAIIAAPHGGGSMGVLDVELGVKPPTGVGLSIDSTGLSGGGYLMFDEERGEYAGAVHLEFEGLALNAVGLLTTRMPDGSPGFSLLVIITASGFTPIQLGFGFALTGVGGLIGVNRTTAVEPLRAALRGSALDSLLMMQSDPVPRAPQLVQALRTFFPPAAGRTLIGPMAMIVWGTPALVTIRALLLLELPEPVRIVVVARVDSRLPSAEKPILSLHMDTLGVLDSRQRTFSLDAVLHDSKVLNFALSGGMALRSRWGANPNFVLAIGGFNPHFEAPPGFPKLERLTVALAAGDDPRLRLSGYFALTSNTLQLGGQLDLYVGAGGFALQGMLGFDGLIHFSPFSFIVDMRADVSLVAGGTTLLSIGLRLTLSGPSPWHAVGSASISILFFSISIHFNLTFGRSVDQPALAAVDLWALLAPELSRPSNWSAQLPAEGSRLVRLRELDPTVASSLVHPLGTLSVRQRLLPLDRLISMFGNTPVTTPRTFQLANVMVGSVRANWTLLNEEFAPAQYRQLTDAERLSAPAFEPQPAGAQLTVSDAVSGASRPAVLAYHVRVFGRDGGELDASTQPQQLDAGTAVALAAAGAAAMSPARTAGRRRYATASVGVSIREQRFVVARRDDLRAAGGVDSGDGSYSAAAEALVRVPVMQRSVLQVVRREEVVP